MSIMIRTRIWSLKVAADTFVRMCECAVADDAGNIDPEDERRLRQFKSVTEKYFEELDAIR